jgi:uncharacterized protein YbaA (DUF1428 family)
MPQYIDGFVIPLPKDKVSEYRQIAEEACSVWMEHGALDYRECIAEDTEAKGTVSFPQLAGAKPHETVVFAWIVYESREHRDAVNAKVMADPRMQKMMAEGPGPFECHRMAYGGFTTIVEPAQAGRLTTSS